MTTVSSKFYQRLLKITALSICAILCLAQLAQALDPPDTTKARDRKEPTKSVGQVIGDIPKEIVTLPLRVIKGGVSLLLYAYKPIEGLFQNPVPDAPFFLSGSYSSTRGLSGGPGISRHNLLASGDRIKLKGTYSFHDYQFYQLDYRSRWLSNNRLQFSLQLQYDRKPWERFYGLGNQSFQDNGVAITQEWFQFRTRLRFQLSKTLTARLESGFYDVKIEDGEDPDRLGNLDSIITFLNLPENNFRQTRFVRTTLALDLDSRDHPGQPSRGGLETLEFSYVEGATAANDLRYYDTRLELSYFINLFRKRILAVRFSARSIDEIGTANKNPYYLQNRLGGQNNLRSFRSGRFTDNDAVLLMLEYRYPLAGGFDGFIFFDQGRVFSDINKDFTLSDWKHSYGAGLRVWASGGELFRITLAHSDERAQFYLKFGSSW